MNGFMRNKSGTLVIQSLFFEGCGGGGVLLCSSGCCELKHLPALAFPALGLPGRQQILHLIDVWSSENTNISNLHCSEVT